MLRHIRSAGIPAVSKDSCRLLQNSKDFMFPQISATDPSPNPHLLACHSFTSSVVPKTFKDPLSNRLIINNDSQKHNYICKCTNLPTTCFGLIRPSGQAGNRPPSWHTLCQHRFSHYPHICKWDLVPPPSHLHLDQTDNFPQMLYSNLKMAELGRNL